MENKIVIGRWEMTFLIINAVTTQVYLGFSRSMAKEGGTAAWMGVILIAIFTMIAFLVIAKLFSAFEGKDILEVSEYVGGNTFRVIIGLVLITHIFIGAPTLLRIFAEEIKIISLTNTPISFIMMFFIICIVISAYIGIESLARLSTIVFFAMTFCFLIIIIGVSPYYQSSNLLPVFGNGLDKITEGGIIGISSFSALIQLYILFPFIKTNKNFKKIGIFTIIISSVIMLLATLSYTLVFPYPTSRDNLIPILHLARLINFGRFFQRIESIFVLMWMILALAYLAGAFYLTVYTFQKSFKLKYYKPLIPACGVIYFCLAFLPRSMMDALNFEGDIFRKYSWISTFLLTILILLFANIKKRKNKGAMQK